tara:strand:+ start:2342 stop:2539 length:198 start_codon:yes stop_codon:yes gene_type:complete
MSETNQSLIKTFLNEDGNVVLVYGSANECDIQSLDLETIIISTEDVDRVLQALKGIMPINQKERL